MATPEVTIEKSLNMQQTTYDLRVAKTDDNVEIHVEQRKDLTRSRHATVGGLRRRIAILRVVLGLGNRPKRVAHDAS